MDKPVRTMTRRERRRKQMKSPKVESELHLVKPKTFHRVTEGFKDAQVKARKVQTFGKITQSSLDKSKGHRGRGDTTAVGPGYVEEPASKDKQDLIILISDAEDADTRGRESSNTSESKNLTYPVQKGSSNSSEQNLTYQVSGEVNRSADQQEEADIHDLVSSPESKNNTYDVEKIQEPKEGRETNVPVAAPRKAKGRESKRKTDKHSDTDEDVMEIELDQDKKQDVGLGDDSRNIKPTVPRPVPRQTKAQNESDKIEVKVEASPVARKDKATVKRKSKEKEIPGQKLPKIASILREMKDDLLKEDIAHLEEDRTDLHMDTPRLPESELNGKIYVQSKSGFHIKNRDDFLRSGAGSFEESDQTASESAIKTAVAFHVYWSRMMLFFHGVVAGVAVCHVVLVTTIMSHVKYNAGEFVHVYTHLALKVHFAFYLLITLCLVSCFDRIDVGHLKKSHLSYTIKRHGILTILLLYLLSFFLTFAAHGTEALMDAHRYEEQTEEHIWTTQTEDRQHTLLEWYRIIWARDVLVLLAWAVVSCTDFTDVLHLHLSSMVKYTEPHQQQLRV